MGSVIYFDNKQISLPGAYSTIVSGETNPARNLDYGKVLIIDTGVLGASFGGGAGVNGQLAQGQDAVYSFLNLADFRSYVKGGAFWKMAEALFFPDSSNPAAIGISELYYVRAATTTSASMLFETAAGGSFSVFTRDEGLWANGVAATGITNSLATGYAYTIVPGIEAPTNWIMKFWRGTYTGTATDGLPFGEETEAQCTPRLVVESPEFSTMGELINWAKTDVNFNVSFSLNPISAVKGDGAIATEDVAKVIGYQKATGGTETYMSTDLNAALVQLTDLDYNIIFSDQFGTNASSAITKSILTHLNFSAKFDHFLYVGGFGESAKFKDSLSLAQGFDSDVVQLIHGDSGINTSQSVLGYRWWGVMYTLAAVVGRVCGKPPYIPVTNKTIGVDRVRHILSEDEKKRALKSGVLVVTKNAFTKKFVILQGVNTLQDNLNLFNAKGQSYSIQFMRIVAQINRELVVNSELDLLGQENGVNVNTLSAGDVKNWTIAYLQSRVATEGSDNLLLRFQDVNVTRKEDSWFVTYKIAVNNEITKLFFTGYLIR